MKIAQNIEGKAEIILVVEQNLGVRRIIPTSDIMGSRRENVIRTIKLICRCRMLFYKSNLQDTEVSTEIILIISSKSM